jgi:hypothetical protein
VATISITVPDALVPRLTAAMRATYPQYQALTDAQCFRQATGDHWRTVLAQYEERVARETAAAQVAATVADGNTIT